MTNKREMIGGGTNVCASSELSKFETIDDLLDNCPVNKTIGDNLIRAWSIINNDKYKKIVCAISGGSDSDVVLDIVWKCDKNNKVEYVWFDTGLEYQATKNHLRFLEEKYNIRINSYKAIKPIPLSCREFGQPFLSKQVSEFMQRLQKHNFQWENDTFENLMIKYPKCKSALEWWCDKKGNKSMFNISQNKYLKEFIIKNPPTFQISNVCCKYAKKDVLHKLLKEYKYDLNVVGIRKAEGGVRAAAYKTCFDENDSVCDNYRPLFWYKNSDKYQYDEHYNIIHSKCYTEYGLKRTGCVGCPFGRDFEQELGIIQEYEPKLYKAVNNIFKDSYEYTRKFKEFYAQKEKELKEAK